MALAAGAAGAQADGTGVDPASWARMASRLFAFVALLLIVAGVAAFLVAAGWIPWTYPIVLFVVGFILWGFVVLRRGRRPRPASARGGRPGLELWDDAGRTVNENPGKR